MVTRASSPGQSVQQRPAAASVQDRSPSSKTTFSLATHTHTRQYISHWTREPGSSGIWDSQPSLGTHHHHHHHHHIFVYLEVVFSALTLLVGWQEGHPACKKLSAGMVICLELGADLHTAQLMPLPLTVSCFSKIQIGFPFLVPAHPGSPGQRAVKRVCVCVLHSHKFM